MLSLRKHVILCITSGEPIKPIKSPSIFQSLSLLAFVACYLVLRASARSARTLPGPGSYPIIGNILSLPIQNPWLTFTKWKVIFGDVVHLRGLRQSIIILNSKQAMDDLLDRRGAIYSNRPQFTVVEMMGLDRGMPLLQHNDTWRLQRKLAKTALNNDAVKEYEDTQAEVAALMCLSLLTDPTHFREHIRLAAGRIIISITYGLPVSDAQHRLITEMDKVVPMLSDATMPGTFIADLFPIFKDLPDWVPFMSFKKEAKKIRAIVDRLGEIPFAQVQKEMAAGTAQVSFTQKLLADRSGEDDESQYNDAVKWSGGSMYGAGGETTHTSVLVFLIGVMQNPAAQKKAQDELDEVIGRDRMPTLEDRAQLPYVDAIIKEIMRWRPAFPLGIPRRVDKDDEYAGYCIPADSIIIPNVWAVAMDVPSGTKYPAADFAPERFLEEHPPVDPALYAFGFGRRVCPGRLLAENSIFLLVTSILYCCTISTPSNHGQKHSAEAIEFSTTGLVSHPMPFSCRIEQRSADRFDVVKRAVSRYT
ncbi:MAG: cytochrome P450 [Lentinula lateritia]|uniref:Cytochrome P450 n=1 Tax=Lentinula lateritia TaxID=40482 RepID=A0ABQ8VGX8_9AGAR|nr:MAG: cytochrome P450 [Lentinula lateritia]KAJ4489814.1 cytochrome P450 [Lentinula lateritia]